MYTVEGKEIVVVQCEEIPCNQKIMIIKVLREYQRNLIGLITFNEETRRLDGLITMGLKEVKEYVDQYAERCNVCQIITREVNGTRVLFDIVWR